MDVYVVRLFGEGFDAPNIEFLSQPSKRHETSVSRPYVAGFLEQRRVSVYGVSLRLTPGLDESSDSSSWNLLHIEDNILKDEEIVSASSNAISDVLLKLSDELPAPGSYILNVVWDMRGVKSSENINDLSPLLGAVKKLCSWHHGRLQVYINRDCFERLKHFIVFMDTHAVIHKVDDGINTNLQLHDRNVWRGHFKIRTKNASICRFPGFSLSKQTIPKLKNHIHLKSDISETPCTNDLLTNEELGHVWLDPGIQVLSFIDITTLPLFYFSGKRFILQYHINEHFQRAKETIQRMRDVVNSSQVGVFLCCINYTVSKYHFDTIPERSLEKWKEAVMKNPRNLAGPDYKFPYNVKTLHFLLRQSEEDSAIKEAEGLIQFTAYLLHRPQELDLTLPFEHDPMCTGRPASEDIPEESTSLNFDDLPVLNPAGLFYKEQNFDGRISEAVQQWADENTTDSIPKAELEKLMNETIQELDTEQESVLLDVTNLPELDPPIKHQEPPDSATLFEWQKQALANFEEIRNEKLSKLNPLAPSNPLLASKSLKSSFDMHFKPEDVLKHFALSGEPKNSKFMPKKAADVEFSVPGMTKLRTFEEAIKMKYHGITYNVDEQAAEKFDRMCRKLVQRHVKFETCSIGSNEKVPSPATINVADSPLKQSKLTSSMGTVISDPQKRMKLKKVAEKLYKKRVRTRSNATPSSSELDSPSCTMVLRSTPKKSQGESSQCVMIEGKRKPITEISTEERKRRRRRTYVQDNKKRLQDLVTQSLIDNGVAKDNKEFESFSKRLYNVSMAFLRDLKSSKGLFRIMKETVSSNVQSVISFKTR